METNLRKPWHAVVLAIALGTPGVAQHVSPDAITGMLQLSGGNERAAWTFGPAWSSELGFHVKGSIGAQIGPDAAVGLVAQYGQNLREGIVNLAFGLPGQTQAILSAGQLRERLVIGADGGRDWVSQDMYGLSFGRPELMATAYMTNSESVGLLVGARQKGVRLAGSRQVTPRINLRGNIGFQSLEWNDESSSTDSLTGGLGVTYRASERLTTDLYVDRDQSETRIGLGVGWAVGRGHLAVNYTAIRGRSGALSNDDRIGFLFSMPLGGGRNAIGNAATLPARSDTRSPLLSQVMKRPDYLPRRVIVKTSVTPASSNPEACPRIVPRNSTTPPVDAEKYTDTYFLSNATFGSAVSVYTDITEFINANATAFTRMSAWTMEGVEADIVGGGSTKHPGESDFSGTLALAWEAVSVGGETGTKTLNLSLPDLSLSCSWTLTRQP